jgi:hypothetical protein
MELSCEGEKRRVRTHKLGGHAIRASQFEDTSLLDKRDEKSGDLEVQWFSDQHVTLNGRFSFTLTLTREDIANLFVAAFRTDTLDKSVEALRKARLTKRERRAEDRASGA